VLKKFSIAAPLAGQVGLYQISIALSTSSASVTNLILRAYQNSDYTGAANVPNTTGGQFGATLTPSGNSYTANFQQTTPFEIGAGTTNYFTLTGNVAPVGTANNWTITATVNGDAAYPTGLTSGNMGQAATVAGSSNFIWSPNATTTATTADIDWTNGFNLPGLSASGL
jgi:hypothetical protein